VQSVEDDFVDSPGEEDASNILGDLASKDERQLVDDVVPEPSTPVPYSTAPYPPQPYPPQRSNTEHTLVPEQQEWNASQVEAEDDEEWVDPVEGELEAEQASSIQPSNSPPVGEDQQYTQPQQLTRALQANASPPLQNQHKRTNGSTSSVKNGSSTPTQQQISQQSQQVRRNHYSIPSPASSPSPQPPSDEISKLPFPSSSPTEQDFADESESDAFGTMQKDRRRSNGKSKSDDGETLRDSMRRTTDDDKLSQPQWRSVRMRNGGRTKSGGIKGVFPIDDRSGDSS